MLYFLVLMWKAPCLEYKKTQVNKQNRWPCAAPENKVTEAGLHLTLTCIVQLNRVLALAHGLPTFLLERSNTTCPMVCLTSAEARHHEGEVIAARNSSPCLLFLSPTLENVSNVKHVAWHYALSPHPFPLCQLLPAEMSCAMASCYIYQVTRWCYWIWEKTKIQDPHTIIRA